MRRNQSIRVRSGINGQAMLEYIVVFGMSMGILILLGMFFYVFKEQGGRVLELIASEYP